MNILVTGADGQLGRCFREESSTNNNWFFTTHKELDITKQDDVDEYIRANSINIVINCAAYTNVEKAEDDEITAHCINCTGPENLAMACKKYNVLLIHFSTDYVFSGSSRTPYIPISYVNHNIFANPLNEYGKSKLNGEISIIDSGCKYLIFRISWLYSKYGNNFVKKMIQKIKDNENLDVVYDQIGCLTSARELAEYICDIIVAHPDLLERTGTYNFCGRGVTSWYDVVVFIKSFFPESTSIISPCLSTKWKSKARRPHYSVLDISGTESTFGRNIDHWMERLRKEIPSI